MGARRLAPGEMARRRRYFEPLVLWLRAHDLVALHVIARVAARRGVRISKQRLREMKVGRLPTPAWLVGAVLAQLDRDYRDVFTAEWLAEFGHEEEAAGDGDGAGEQEDQQRASA